MKHRTLAALVFVCHLLPPAPAGADSLVDGIEHILGASNVHAITGHGRMSVGISADGDGTVLTWPNPSYADQIAYATTNALDAREQPRFGAPEAAGFFCGLHLVDIRSEERVVWLRDRDVFTISQSYGPTDGPNVHTMFASDALGLEILMIDAIGPAAVGGAADVLVRTVRVTRDASSEFREASLLTYANLSPVPPESRIDELPIADWAMDGRNDFAAVWDGRSELIVHFHPSDQRVHDEMLDLLAAPAADYGPIGELLGASGLTASALEQVVDDLETAYGGGAWLALTTSPPPSEFQVGYDATDFCAIADALIDNLKTHPDTLPGFEADMDPTLLEGLRCRGTKTIAETKGWTHVASDAWADVSDGSLEFSPIAAGEVNEALRTELGFVDDGGSSVAEVHVIIAAGPSASEARDAATDARDAPGAVAEAAEARLKAWLEGIRLPTTGSGRLRAVARRALINIGVGTDARTGAIVASITRQPPYGLDWPRDGAFFNMALDLSGQSELVGRRVALYQAWQRDEPVEPTPLLDPEPPPDPETGSSDTFPADAWEMNYYPDGRPGGFIRFEIDNVGLLLWSMVAHSGWEAERDSYLASIWDTVRRGAELLVRWRDPETGLHAPANEDDDVDHTQTLHGAVTTYAGLDAAARVARALGHDDEARRYVDRAEELRAATLEHLYDSEGKRFIGGRGTAINPGSAPSGPTAWLVWPAKLLPWIDARVQRQLEIDQALIRPTIDLEDEGGAYFLKNLVSLALVWGADPDHGAEVRRLLEKVADHATATDHFGEVMVTLDTPGGPVADQRTATPHLWEGTLFYLAAMALEDPEAFDGWEDALPAGAARADAAPGLDGTAVSTDVAATPDGSGVPQDEDSGGCGCDLRRSRSPAPAALAWVAMLLLAAGLRRRPAP